MIRSLAFNVVGFTWTAFMMVVSLPVLAMPRPWILAPGRVWVRGLMWLLRILVGLDYTVRGRDNLPKGPFIVAAKHQSAWDTLVFPLIFADPAYVLKRELTWVPPFGWYLLRQGAVPIDRRGGAAAMRRMLRGAKRIAEQDRPIIIYPEGTRTPPGESRAYHPGVALLYRELDLPVVPIALNSGRFWARHAFRKHPGTITVDVLPPIQPGLDRRAFMARLHETLEPAAHALLDDG